MKTARVGLAGVALLVVVVALSIPGLVQAADFSLTTTVTTDGAASSAGGSLSIACRASSSSSWTSCGSSVAAGTEVSIDAVANPDYWFMWFTSSPYLAGCTTINYGWGCFCANPITHCGFTMPSSSVSINAEFQVP